MEEEKRFLARVLRAVCGGEGTLRKDTAINVPRRRSSEVDHVYLQWSRGVFYPKMEKKEFLHRYPHIFLNLNVWCFTPFILMPK